MALDLDKISVSDLLQEVYSLHQQEKITDYFVLLTDIVKLRLCNTDYSWVEDLLLSIDVDRLDKNISFYLLHDIVQFKKELPLRVFFCQRVMDRLADYGIQRDYVIGLLYNLI
jgi:hypothetical protein